MTLTHQKSFRGFACHGVVSQVVNALLTQLDSLRRFINVFVMATSNITEAIGNLPVLPAFVPECYKVVG